MRRAADAERRGAFGPERRGCRVGLRAEGVGAAPDVELQRRAVAAVVFGLDADAAHLSRRGTHDAALLGHGVEACRRALHPRQPDRLVARTELHGVAAHGVAAAREVVREAVHAVFEAGLAVHRERDAPDAERIVHAVAAVGDFGHEVPLAARADGLFARQAVAAFGFADHGVADRTAVYGNPVQRIDLDVVQAHDPGREVVLGADHPFAHDVAEPLRRRVAQFEVEVRAHRRAAVARKSDRVALPRRATPRRRTGGPTPFARRAVALFAHAFLDVVAEPLQVAVHGRRAVVERQVDRPSVASRGQRARATRSRRPRPRGACLPRRRS